MLMVGVGVTSRGHRCKVPRIEVLSRRALKVRCTCYWHIVPMWAMFPTDELQGVATQGLPKAFV